MIIDPDLKQFMKGATYETWTGQLLNLMPLEE